MAKFGRGTLDILAGKTNRVIAAKNAQMLWKARAASARLTSRVDQIQANQEKISQSLTSGINSRGGSASSSQNLATGISSAVNPFSIENLTITTVHAGDDRKSKEKADKVNSKNIKLFEELNKSVSLIAENTKKVVQQNTKANKTIKGSGSGSGSGGSIKIGDVRIKKVKGEGSGLLDMMAGFTDGLFKLLGGLTAISALAALAKSLIALPLSAVLLGMKAVSMLGSLGKTALKTTFKVVKGLIKLPRYTLDRLKDLGKISKAGWNKTKDFFKAVGGAPGKLAQWIAIKSRQGKNLLMQKGILGGAKMAAFRKFLSDPNETIGQFFDRLGAKTGILKNKIKNSGLIKSISRFNRYLTDPKYFSKINQSMYKKLGTMSTVAAGAAGKAIGKVKGGAAALKNMLGTGAKAVLGGSALKGAGGAMARGAGFLTTALLPMLMNPVVLVPLAIATVGYGIARLLGYSNEDIIDTVFVKPVKWLSAKWEGIKAFFSGGLTDIVKSSFVFKSMVEWWGSWDIASLWQDAQWFWEDLKKDPLGTLADAATGTAKYVLDAIGGGVDNFFSWIWDGITDKINNYVISPIANWWNGVVSGNMVLPNSMRVDPKTWLIKKSGIKGRNEDRITARGKAKDKKDLKRNLMRQLEASQRAMASGDTSPLQIQNYMTLHKIYKENFGKDYDMNIKFMDTKYAAVTKAYIKEKTKDAANLKGVKYADIASQAANPIISLSSALTDMGGSLGGITSNPGKGGDTLSGNQKKAAQIISANEGGYNDVNPNDAGKGIAFGAYQFNGAALQYVLSLMVAAGVPGASQYQGQKSGTSMIKWLKSIGNTPISKKIQDRVFVERFYNPAARLASKKNITDPKAILHIMDHTVNAGPGGAASMLTRVQDGASSSEVAEARLSHYKSMSKWSQFSKSWTKRVLAIQGGKAANIVSNVSGSIKSIVKNAGDKVSSAMSGFKMNSMTISEGTGQVGAMAANAAAFLGKGFTYSQGNRGVKGAGVLMDGATSMDCSSFVALIVNKTYGIPMGTFGGNTVTQYKYLNNKAHSTRVTKGSEQPGDIVMYMGDYVNSGKNHTAIVSKKGKQIHMSSSANGIVESGINWNGGRTVHIFRINPLGATANVITGMPAITAGSNPLVNGVQVLAAGGSAITNVNNSLENLQTEIFNIRSGIMSKEQKELKKEGKDGLYGIIPAPSCTH